MFNWEHIALIVIMFGLIIALFVEVMLYQG